MIQRFSLWNMYGSLTYISWFSDLTYMHIHISAHSCLLKFHMKMFVIVARLEIDQMFTQGVWWGQPCTLDTFLVYDFI